MSSSGGGDLGFYALLGFCALLFVVDVFIHKHGPFSVEYLWGFYGLLGLLPCAALIVLAKLFGILLMRREDYYDR